MAHTRDFSEQIQRLNSFFKQRQYDEAIALAENILAYDPDNYIAHIVRAHSELLKPTGNLQAATSDVRWAITNHSDKPHGFLLLAKIHCQLSCFADAISMAHLAISRGLNDNLELDCTLALSYYGAGDYENACKHFRKVIEREPDMLDYHYGLAKSFNLLCEDKDLSQITENEYLDLALRSLQAIINHNRNDIKTYTIYAEILLKIQQYQDAITKASEAIRLLGMHPFEDPDENLSQLTRNYYSRSEAHALLPTPDHTQAARDLKHIGRVYKDINISIPANILMARARSEFFLGNYEKALKYYRVANTARAEFDFNNCHRFAITYKTLADNIVVNKNSLTDEEIKAAYAYYNNAILMLKNALAFNENTPSILQEMHDCYVQLSDDMNIFTTRLNITKIKKGNQLQLENYQVCSLRELSRLSIFENYEKVKKHVTSKGGLSRQENAALQDNGITPEKIRPAFKLLGKRTLRSTSFFPQQGADEAKEPATKKARKK